MVPTFLIYEINHTAHPTTGHFCFRINDNHHYIYWMYESWVATRFVNDPFGAFLVLLDKKIPIHPAGKIKIVMYCMSFTSLALAGITDNADLTTAGVVFSILGVFFTALSIPRYLNPPD